MTEQQHHTPPGTYLERSRFALRAFAEKLRNLKQKIVGHNPEKSFYDHQLTTACILELESALSDMTNEQLIAESISLKTKIQQFLLDTHTRNPEILEQLEQQAFAIVREASTRFAQLSPYEIQTIGALILHDGAVLEMKTGEGKTLTAIQALYTHALRGEGAHLVTSNEYLARRDGGLAGKILHPLGMRVACIGRNTFSAIYDPSFVSPDIEDELLAHWKPCTRQEAYAADVTYGTASEFGFDYLRDTTVLEVGERVQRKLSFALIDEVDNILIDDARDPLILTELKKNREHSRLFTSIIEHLKNLKESTAGNHEEPNEDYYIDPKTRSVILTEQGWDTVEQRIFNKHGITTKMLYGFEDTEDTIDSGHTDDTHKFYIAPLLKALYAYTKGVHYLVQNKQVVLLDQSTGRPQPGQRYEDGLHEALEAKEGITIQPESVTIATISPQLYFRMYQKLAGMTGTALPAADELEWVYGLQVCDVPTNVQFNIQTGQLPLTQFKREHLDGIETYYANPDTPNKPEYFERIDYPDIVVKTAKEAIKQAFAEIVSVHATGRPVLVGTATIGETRQMSELLTRAGLAHQVLTAENHTSEAELIAQAGRYKAITISTNMAGRGVDILLGGNPQQLAVRAVLDSAIFQIDEKKYNYLLQLIAACARHDEAEISVIRTKYPIFDESVIATIHKSFQQTKDDHDRVRKLGGLHVVGIERRESRRIDDQLRGRAARQGDPGSSRFFVSFESPLFKLFGESLIARVIKSALLPASSIPRSNKTTTLLDTIQGKAESAAKDLRKAMLSYDLVLDTQRRAMQSVRNTLLTANTDTLQTYILQQFELGQKNNTSASKQSTIEPERLREFLSDKQSMSKVRRKLLSILNAEWKNFLAAEKDFRRQMGTAGSVSAIDQFKRSTHSAFMEMQQDIAKATLAALRTQLQGNLQR